MALRAGFEPTRGDPIGFQVQRLNHSAIVAYNSRRSRTFYSRDGCPRIPGKINKWVLGGKFEITCQARFIKFSYHRIERFHRNKNIKRNCGQKIDDEPAFEVVNRNALLVRDNFIVCADIGCHEVDENVDDKHNVNDSFDDDQPV